jgi:hypothetical protein
VAGAVLYGVGAVRCLALVLNNFPETIAFDLFEVDDNAAHTSCDVEYACEERLFRDLASPPEGAIRVSQGFSARPSGLQAGSQDVAALQSRCQAIAQYIVVTLQAMAGASGHTGLAAAFNDAAGKGGRGYTGAWAAYGHASQGLAASAKNYSDAEQAIISQIPAVAPGILRGRLQP